jgi:hypothetical protein
MPTIIAKLQQNAVTKSRVTWRDIKGRRLIATRLSGQDEAGKRQPTIEGIALTIERRPEWPDALATLAQAMQAQSSWW